MVRISLNNKEIDITLDSVSWLPVKEASISLADPSRPVPSENQIEAWTTVQGIHFPARIRVLHEGIRLAEITSEKIELNRGLKAQDLANKPADFRPEISHR